MLTGDWGEGSRSKLSTPSRGHAKSKDLSGHNHQSRDKYFPQRRTDGKDDGGTVCGVSESRTVFSALVFSSVSDGFNIDIYIDGKFVDHCSNRNVELVLGVCDVRFPGLSSSVLARGCRTVEWEGLTGSAGPARTSYSGMPEVRS
jgi:hypothetical protein